eukprot:PhF_6_TR35411/c0_g1_i1/m.51538
MATYFFNPSTWMRDLAPSISHKPFSALAIPGSHDSCTDNITSDSSVCPSAPDIATKFGSMFAVGGVVKKIISGWSRCQQCGVYDQLKKGVRYLDVRISSRGAEIWTVHGMHSTSFSSVLSSIERFLSDPWNAKEIIVIDVNHVYNLYSPHHEDFVRLVQTILGPFLIHAGKHPDAIHIPLQRIWDEKLGNVIVTFEEVVPGIIDSSSGFFLHKNLVESAWPNTSDIETLKRKLLTTLTERVTHHSSKLHVSQGIFTPDEDMIKAALVPFSSSPSNVRDMIKSVNPHILSWWCCEVPPHVRNNRNIFILDFFDVEHDGVSAANAIIRLNCVEDMVVHGSVRDARSPPDSPGMCVVDTLRNQFVLSGKIDPFVVMKEGHVMSFQVQKGLTTKGEPKENNNACHVELEYRTGTRIVCIPGLRDVVRPE